MSATINERLQDILLKRGTDWEKFKGSEVRRLLTVLAEADASALEKLEKRLERLGPVEQQAFGAGRYTTERLIKVREALDEMTDQAADIMQRDLGAVMLDAAKEEAEFQPRMFFRVGVVNEWVTPSTTLLRAVVRSRPFEGAILREHTREWGRAKKRRALSEIRTGLVLGDPIPDVVRRLRGTKARNFKDGAIEASRQSAERIARTAIAHVTNGARAESYRANADILRGVKWTATLDNRTCRVCGSLDGKVFPVNANRIPPEHYSCRCVMIPVTAISAQLGPGLRASDVGPVPGDVTFEQWLKTKPASVQDDVLGTTGGRLFRKGGVKLDGFVDKRGNEFTITDLKRREPQAFREAGIDVE